MVCKFNNFGRFIYRRSMVVRNDLILGKSVYRYFVNCHCRYCIEVLVFLLDCRGHGEIGTDGTHSSHSDILLREHANLR